jgi:hypothetical protein
MPIRTQHTKQFVRIFELKKTQLLLFVQDGENITILTAMFNVGGQRIIVTQNYTETDHKATAYKILDFATTATIQELYLNALNKHVSDQKAAAEEEDKKKGPIDA